MPKLAIFGNKSWSQITREERFFCAELFQCLKNDLSTFLELIGRTGKTYDIGFEVCFYRDVLKHNGRSARKEDISTKRTFDLMLISADELIIIEAKAAQGFDNKQLDDFEKDKERITKLYELLDIEVPKVTIIALHSTKYSPSSETKGKFENSFTWKKLSQIYPSAKVIFERAEEIYNQ